MSSPPAFEFQIARHFRVDLGIKVVLLRPKRIGRIEILEVFHQPSAVEYSIAQIADHCRQPATPKHAAGITHGVLPAHAGPIGHRRSRQDNRAAQIRIRRRQHHNGPSRLTVADDHGLFIRLGMQFGDPL